MKFLLIILGCFFINLFTFSQELKTVNTQILNLRNGAGTEFEIIHQLNYGDTVKAFSTIDTWTEIESKTGIKGYVSSQFLSKCENSVAKNTSTSKINDSWFIYLFFGIVGLILLNTARKTLFSTSRSGIKSNTVRKNQTKQQSVNSIKRNAVYRFRIKGNGRVGNVQYVDGMNLEVAISGLGASGSPFNTTLQKLFVQEFARKYNVAPKDQSAIVMLFKPDRLDVELL